MCHRNERHHRCPVSRCAAVVDCVTLSTNMVLLFVLLSLQSSSLACSSDPRGEGTGVRKRAHFF